MRVTLTGAALMGLSLGLGLTPIISQAQSGVPATRTAATTTPGRFQLMMAAQNSAYLVDTVTGRVWQDMKVVSNAEAMRKYVDAAFAKDFTPATLRDPSGAKQRLEAEYKARFFSSPCHGMENCFLEIDRTRLMADGGWVSEVVK